MTFSCIVTLKGEMYIKCVTASCTPARLNAARRKLLPLGYLIRSIRMGKAEQVDFLEGLLFPGGGASKPHRSKYILVVDRIVQLPRLWLHPFFFSFALSRLWIALSRFILSEAFLLLSCISFSFVKLRIKGCIHLCSFILL